MSGRDFDYFTLPNDDDAAAAVLETLAVPSSSSARAEVPEQQPVPRWQARGREAGQAGRGGGGGGEGGKWGRQHDREGDRIGDGRVYGRLDPVDTSGWKFGEEMRTFDLRDLERGKGSVPRISDVRFVVGYNWLEGREDVIFVPGCPPVWAPPKGPPPRLQPDSGRYFRDLNAALCREYPTEPAVRALMAWKPEFDLGSIDIVACGSTLGNLLRFTGSAAQPFRFDVDFVGRTVFFIRKENSPTEVLQNVKGYGHRFPETYTQWDQDVAGSTSHQRVIQYHFGGMRFLVRFEVDGYKQEEIATSRVSKAQTPSLNEDKKADSAKKESSFLSAANKMTLGGKEAPSTKSAGLHLKMRGREIAQSQIFDIKTRYFKNLIRMEEVLPRLWVTQIPNFLLAYNNIGVFGDIRMQDVRGDLQKWESDHGDQLCRFQELVKQVVDAVSKTEAKRAEVSWRGEGPIVVSKQLEERRALPEELRKEWVCFGKKAADNKSK